MPAVNVRRVIAAALSTALLLGSMPAAFAADDPGGSFVAPPTIAAALASLTEPSGVVVAAADVTSAKVRLPACEVQDKLTRYRKPKQWQKTLLDTNLKIGRDYQPWDLVSVRRADIAGSGQVRAKIDP